MNLPFILDLAIGLVFIYLILSLLASEIQELLATLFQWRAEHLKKSIEILLTGSTGSPEEDRVIILANKIYENPLIKNLNQEAKGWMVTLPRKFTWMIGRLFRYLKKARPGSLKSETIFGDNNLTGPSYIPAETFATTLIETLEISTFIQKLTEARLEKFKQERLEELKEVLNDLYQHTNKEEYCLLNDVNEEFDELDKKLNKVVYDFKQKKASLDTSIKRMSICIDFYTENIGSYQDYLPKQPFSSQVFLRRITSIKQEAFDNNERAILLGGLRPTLTEIIQSLDKTSAVHKEIAAEITKNKDIEAIEKIQKVTDSLPDCVIKSLYVLAKRGEARVKSTEENINQLREELEIGFERSMERASGVYKRNAKGLAILIGLFVAVVANADTFNIVSRLSKDSDLHTAIAQSASQAITNTSEIETVKDQVERALNDVPLPLGWTRANVCQQIGWTKAREDKNKSIFAGPESICNPPSGNQQQSLAKGWIFPILQRIPGWILSGFAIAMGAPFWFELIGKFINVRNAGKPPASSANKQAASNDRTAST